LTKKRQNGGVEMNRKGPRGKEFYISWYLKFIQADLDYLDDQDISLPLHLLVSLLPASIGDWPRIAKQHEHWFRDLKIRKERPAPTYVKIGDRTLETKKFLRAREVQKKLREFLSKILNEKFGAFELLPRAKIVLSKERDHVPFGLEMADDTNSMPRWFQIRHYPIGKDGPGLNLAVLNFASLLNGLPVDSIRRCKECESYFVNLSKREKVFCDIKCAWKNHARLAREEIKKHPQKLKEYRSKQKVLMWHRYEKRVKAENPNAKIKRRVRYGPESVV
jgi:hypothetical protein